MSNITNRRLVEQNSPDFYPTPAWGTQALLKYETFEGNILEPCCGEGDMSEILKTAGNQIISSDLFDRGYGSHKDFLTYGEKYDNIITNPPYAIAEQILEHALNLYNKKICLLLRLAFLESISRYNKFYSNTPPQRVLIFSERLSMYPKNYEVKGGGTTSYGWFIWDKNDNSTETKLNWIAPGLKPKYNNRQNKI